MSQTFPWGDYCPLYKSVQQGLKIAAVFLIEKEAQMRIVALVVVVVAVIGWTTVFALAQELSVGAVPPMVEPLPKEVLPSKFMVAKGECLADKEFPELAALLHKGANWPNGRCDATHFRLPKLDCEIGGMACQYLIKVKP